MLPLFGVFRPLGYLLAAVGVGSIFSDGWTGGGWAYWDVKLPIVEELVTDLANDVECVDECLGGQDRCSVSKSGPQWEVIWEVLAVA